MKIALVHDYFSELGGAERVLRVLADMYPDAPIYTSFKVKGSQTDKAFADRQVRESFLAPILSLGRLYSPLRFLAPLVWRSLNLSEFDLVIASSSWFITRGFRVGKNTKVICYCHTPPRYLYGYETSVDLTRYWPVRVYASLVNHFLRLYDFWAAQTVDKFIANSENVKARISKFYRKDSIVIYPPVEVKKIATVAAGQTHLREASARQGENYFLIVSRLVGGKGIEEAAEAAGKIGFKLLVVGESAGFSKVKQRLGQMKNVELLGRVNDEELYQLYAEAKGFIALARNEDFGITVVEAQAAGTPVITYNGGGFRESVISGTTGLLIDDTSIEGLEKALKKFEKINWDKGKIQKNAQRFSRESFEQKIRKIVEKI